MNTELSEGTRRIERVFQIKFSPAELYELISVPSGLTQWFCHQCAERPFGFNAAWVHEDGRVEQIDCAVVRTAPPDVTGKAEFHIRWESEYLGHDTIAQFLIQPDGEGSRLDFIEMGFADGEQWDRAYRVQSDGWDECFANLQKLSASV